MGNVLLIFVEKFKFCRNNRRKPGCPKGSVKGQARNKELVKVELPRYLAKIMYQLSARINWPIKKLH